MNFNEDFKINILFRFKSGPWGGANNFLRIFRSYLIEKGLYTSKATHADIIIFNSDKASVFYLTKFLFPLRLKYNKYVINRIDGPISLRSTTLNFMDGLIGRITDSLSDGSIFQSNWSFNEMKKLINVDSERSTIIHNTADNSFFYPKSKDRVTKKIRLVAASWSDNFEYKGFPIYQYLDKNLDFANYEMILVGKSNVQFENIKIVSPVNQRRLGEYFRESDIFISASKYESCSNVVIEALQCGLPSVLIDSGSLPELLSNGGLTFKDKNDVIDKIKQVSDNLQMFKSNILLSTKEEICESYLTFINKIIHMNKKSQTSYNLKKLRAEIVLRFYKDYIIRKINKYD